jgi:hypothetical protein
MSSKHRREPAPVSKTRQPDVPLDTPEWLEEVRLRVEREAPLMQALMRRAIAAVMTFAALSEDTVVNASSAPNDLAALVRALSSDELLEDLKQAEPLAPAFIRGIEAKRRLIEEHGGTLAAEQVGQIIGISRQAVEKRRQAGKLIALAMGRHGYRYPVWQFHESGTLPGLEEVLAVLAPHDEWMKTIFFIGENLRLADGAPVEMLKAGKVKQVLDAAQTYGEHGSA